MHERENKIRKQMGTLNKSTTTTENLPTGFTFSSGGGSYIILFTKLNGIHFIMHTDLNKSTSNCEQQTEIQKLTQQTWSFSSCAGDGDFSESAGLSAPQFCLLHLVRNG